MKQQKIESILNNNNNNISSYMKKSIKTLKGYLSYINPNSMLINSSYTKLRKLLVEDVYDIVKLPDNVFEDAKVETIIIAIQKSLKSDTLTTKIFPKDLIIKEISTNNVNCADKKGWINQSDCIFNIYVNSDTINLLQKIEGG